MNTIRLKPPRIALALLVLSVSLHLSFTRHNAAARQCLLCAGALFLLGFAVMIWAWTLFRRAGTAIRPTDTATQLVTSGPFRFSRNPMYAGILLMLFAGAWGVGTWPMLIAPVGFFLITSLVFIPHEERVLQQLFGETYVAYQKRVRRWI